MAEQSSHPIRCPHCHREMMKDFEDRVKEMAQRMVLGNTKDFLKRQLPILAHGREVDCSDDDDKADVEQDRFIREALAMIRSDNPCAVIQLQPGGKSQAEYALSTPLEILRMIRCLRGSIRDLEQTAERMGLEIGQEDATDG